jgi:hypothetical protein
MSIEKSPYSPLKVTRMRCLEIKNLQIMTKRRGKKNTQKGRTTSK